MGGRPVKAGTRGMSRREFQDWFAAQAARNPFGVRRIPFEEMTGWGFDRRTGNLVHDSGRFFSVEGVGVRDDSRPARCWSQPMIVQPEIGILGILVRRIDGEPYCLMQTKMEPGNVNGLQLSPTVQATRSNYTRVHRGRTTRYLEYFVRPSPGRIVADVLQSEQGTWFYRKRNRNMIVEIDEDVPVQEGFCWLPLERILDLLQVDDLVNMDARSVLSALGRPTGARRGPDTEFGEALARSAEGQGEVRSMVEVLSWFTDAKARRELQAGRIPLNEVSGWRLRPDRIVHETGKYFSVIAVAVEAAGREVHRWTQPLIAPQAPGIVAFLVKRFGGVPHLLMRAGCEPGYLDVVEMGPTVQCTELNYRDLPEYERPPFLDYVLAAAPERIRYSAVLSEEGGRFYHARNRYLVVESDDDFPSEMSADYCWMSVRQCRALLAHSHYLNIEARSLLACIHSLTSGGPR
ncbi:NDP-hexose 2,3-dehydratase family protein [Actinoallomurus purpureus]|uniref:NDP-hexose 2,3-dehydratase family protein n=1 Tax=Actinoallomurus purpureus TaxID=478114 RepID=UPI002092844D|nr:NDP-hexose 2,3-dehydratase family protein [Actinoallomurus purpureus]MCO6008404.1 NDP-hexose 2,3-dehydratase family protein [Actinoallomurus purpureus]